MNRGALRAEESLFSWALNKEGFLASLGMTTMGTFSANCEAVIYKHFRVVTQELVGFSEVQLREQKVEVRVIDY